MKALVDGKIVELTEEQEKELINIQFPQEVTDKQRISALESAIADLSVMLAGGVDNGWVYQNTV